MKRPRDKRYIISLFVTVVGFFALVTGTSYAILRGSTVSVNEQVITAGSVELKLTENFNSIENGASVMKDADGLLQETVYEFSVTNIGSVAAKYDLKLLNEAPSGQTALDDEYIRLGLEVNGQEMGPMGLSKVDSVIDSNTIYENEVIRYKLRVWLDKSKASEIEADSTKKAYLSLKVDAKQAEYTEKKVLVNLNANGGTIPAGNDWSGTGNTAKKELLAESTYGNLPIPTRTGYTFAGWTVVSEDYQQIEYLQSSGNQYIDTGLQPTNTLSADIVYTDTSATGSNYVLGSRSTSSSTIMYAISGTQSGLKISAVFAGQGSSYTITRVANEKYHIHIVPEYDQTNGYRLYANLEDITSNQMYEVYTPYVADGVDDTVPNIHVFGYNSNNIHKGMQLYTLKFTDNKALMRSFIPCINKTTNKAGLCDLVESKFYGSKNSNDFSAGPVSYVTSSTELLNSSDHTLTAVWTAN